VAFARSSIDMKNSTEHRNGASHSYHALNFEVERNFCQPPIFRSTFTYAEDMGPRMLRRRTRTISGVSACADGPRRA